MPIVAVAQGELVVVEPGAQVTWVTSAGPQAGTVVHTHERDGADVLEVAVRSMKWGKPRVHLEHVPASDVEPEAVIPATKQQRQEVARRILAALGARPGAFRPWELSLLGYAAAMASADAEHRARRDEAWHAPVRPAAALWE